MPPYIPSDNLPRSEPAERLPSVDTYRGFIMLCMVSGGLGISRVAKTLADEGASTPVWNFLSSQCSHAQWTGATFWDLIQPSFIFIIGLVMPFSFAKRCAMGQTPLKRGIHVLCRALGLFVLGVLLSFMGGEETHWTFVNVLCQIGLAYPFAYLAMHRGMKVQVFVVSAILLTYWALFAFWPLPGPDYDYAGVGVGEDWDRLKGFFAHWNKNANPAHYFDRWFHNLFPRSQPFGFNAGGYQTLNFVPSIATMLFGAMAGKILGSRRPPARKFKFLLIAGFAGLVVGWLLHQSACPIVKRIWTPSWVVFSAGWACLFLAGFFYLMDIKARRKWAFPFVVVGMNSIAIYMMAKLFKGGIRKALEMLSPPGAFAGVYGPMPEALVILLVLWLITWWLYHKKLFLKI